MWGWEDNRGVGGEGTEWMGLDHGEPKGQANRKETGHDDV